MIIRMITHSVKTPHKSLVLGMSTNRFHRVLRTALDRALYALPYYNLKDDRMYEQEDPNVVKRPTLITKSDQMKQPKP